MKSLGHKVWPRPIPDAEHRGIRRDIGANFVAVVSAPPTTSLYLRTHTRDKSSGILLNRNKRGFSIVETLVVVGIIALISSISLVSISSLSRSEALSANAAALATRLRDARARTLASVGGMQHGVAISTSSITFFKGSTYDPASSTNDVFILSSYVRASTSLSSIVFERITGNSSASGTIEMFLVSDPSKKKLITVQSSGLVNIK